MELCSGKVQSMGLQESDRTEWLTYIIIKIVFYFTFHTHAHTHTHTHTHIYIYILFSFLQKIQVSMGKLFSRVVFDSLWPHEGRPPGSSVHGISLARILEWVAISFSRGSFWPRDQTHISCIAERFFTIWATRKVGK